MRRTGGIKLSRVCYCIAALLAGHALLAGTSSAVPALPEINHLPLSAIMASVALAFGIAARFGSANRGLRRDLAHLTGAAKRIRSLDLQIDPDAFVLGELQECAKELSSLAEWVRAEHSRLNRDASHDPLTGLPNRRVLLDVLRRESAASKRETWPLSLIMVDLDHFKQLNDTHGHQTGDIVLKRAAQRLASLVRGSDVTARVGGEEFAIVLPRAELERAVEIAWQLRDALRCDPITIDQLRLQITASFGVAEAHACGAGGPDSLVRLADAALYRAKETGRDKVVAAERAEAEEGSQPDDEQVSEDAQNGLDLIKDLGVGADTMAVMGSTFSIMRLIPDKHRVACDTLQQVVATLGYDRVVLWIFEENTQKLIPLASLGHCEPSKPSQPCEPAEDLSAWFMRLRTSGDSFPERTVELLGPFASSRGESTSSLRVPLVAYGGLVGAIEVFDVPSDFRVSEQAHRILSAVCLIGAAALKVCNIFEVMERNWSQVVHRLHQTEAGETFRPTHPDRVSRLCIEVAESMGILDEQELSLIRTASLIHDIGNVGIPKRIRTRKGRLRPREWQLIREHCRIGAKIVGSSPDMGRLAQVILHHHERYDGRGYPDGLLGEEIPLESRILAVADAYDAMTSDRPHRGAMPHEEAIRRIQQASGTQFDPTVVEVFLRCVNRQRKGRLGFPILSTMRQS
ncbi:MAG: diguanylate cyclase [Phycisphaerales bacterium]|nr:MAG: diguanylate cyclase [Phycisphaerales bacterium]